MTENSQKHNFPTRKPTRLQNYDYSQNGCYFVTVCVQNRKPILSTIVGGAVLAAFKRFVNQEIGENIWQRGFYDRIIRNETEYLRAWEYIEYNALKEYGQKTRTDQNPTEVVSI